MARKPDPVGEVAPSDVEIEPTEPTIEPAVELALDAPRLYRVVYVGGASNTFATFDAAEHEQVRYPDLVERIDVLA